MTHCLQESSRSCPLEQEGLCKQEGSFEDAHAVGVEPGPPAVWTVWPGTVLFSGGGRVGGVQEPPPVPVILR